MKSCEVCGETNDRVGGKLGKHKMDLCSKHRHHMNRYGVILPDIIRDRKVCEVCGSTDNVRGINGKHKMALCGRHRMQMDTHGRIMEDKVPEVKYCEVCGSTEGIINGKTGRFKMNLCQKHMGHMELHGKILDRTKLDPNEIIIHDDFAEIVCYDMNSNITGRVKIDISNIVIVKPYKWNIGNKISPVSTTTQGKVLTLPKLLLKYEEPARITYRNKDITDCRRENLMLGTHANALQNARVGRRNTSGHKGVSWDTHGGKWRPTITVNNKCIHLGSFSDINDAIAARKAAEAKYFGEFAYDPSRDVTLNKQEELHNETM